MSEHRSVGCCFVGCERAGDFPSLRIELWPPPDGDPVIMWAHRECFAESTDRAIDPDPPSEHGRIPAQARCVFCSDKLPRIGVHPYSLDVGDSSPPDRYWGHAHCIGEQFGSVPGSPPPVDIEHLKEQEIGPEANTRGERGEGYG